MAGRSSQNSKRKCTDRMNADVLACNIEAIALTKLESPPLDKNGKKKGTLFLELYDLLLTISAPLLILLLFDD